jgi:hypothetical protein
MSNEQIQIARFIGGFCVGWAITGWLLALGEQRLKRNNDHNP